MSSLKTAAMKRTVGSLNSALANGLDKITEAENLTQRIPMKKPVRLLL
jgi:hypothetical protein